MLEPFCLKTALDVGCGVGFFSRYLSGLGLKVLGVDGREENVAEAKRRVPSMEFQVWNIEDPRIQNIGIFDLTLCLGLLYHLENPFLAIRNLCAVTEKVLWIESVIAPGGRPLAVLGAEPETKDQGLRHVALVPSEPCLVKMLYRAGFPHVYATATMPTHEDFRETIAVFKKRTILVAAKIPLQFQLLRSILEPTSTNLWIKPWRSRARWMDGIPKSWRGGAKGFLRRMKRLRQARL